MKYDDFGVICTWDSIQRGNNSGNIVHVVGDLPHEYLKQPLITKNAYCCFKYLQTKSSAVSASEYLFAMTISINKSNDTEIWWFAKNYLKRFCVYVNVCNFVKLKPQKIVLNNAIPQQIYLRIHIHIFVGWRQMNFMDMIRLRANVWIASQS